MEPSRLSANPDMGRQAKDGATLMQRLTESILAVLGALLCIAGAIGFWQHAQRSSPYASVWPLPALVLIEWLLLGMVGAIAALAERQSARSVWTTIRWIVCGALFGLLIMGGFSIGPLVLLAALAFLCAAILTDHRYQRKVGAQVGLLTAGTVGNIGLLLTLIRLVHVS
jgi:hypothetical protein